VAYLPLVGLDLVQDLSLGKYLLPHIWQQHSLK
jgi:hypothetical protein